MVERINKLLVPSIIINIVAWAGLFLATLFETLENPMGNVLCVAGLILWLICVVTNIIICVYTRALSVVFKKIVMWPYRSLSILGIIPMVILFFAEYSILFFWPFLLLPIAKWCASR